MTSTPPVPLLGAHSTLLEVAAAVSDVLTRHDIPAMLSGGGAASLYSNGEYLSYDLDFVTSAGKEDLVPAMAEIGFVPKTTTTHDAFTGRHFFHEGVSWVVEFPGGPVELGNTYIRYQDGASIQTPLGGLRVLTPTQCVMDRLAWYFSGTSTESAKQARMVIAAQGDHIDWDELVQWARDEGVSQEELNEFRT